MSINHICNFLIYLFKLGHQVSYINVARSSLSFFLQSFFDVGEDHRIKRLFRFFWRKRPSFPRYLITWDVSKVLSFLASWHPPSSLSLKDLTLKCVALVAITSSDRAQSIQLMDIENNEINHEGIFFPIYALLKTSKRNRPVTVVKCVKFNKHPPLDVCHYITSYMQRTLNLRIQEVSRGNPKPTQLFISYSTGKPLRRASISKYILPNLKVLRYYKCIKSQFQIKKY